MAFRTSTVPSPDGAATVAVRSYGVPCLGILVALGFYIVVFPLLFACLGGVFIWLGYSKLLLLPLMALLALACSALYLGIWAIPWSNWKVEVADSSGETIGFGLRGSADIDGLDVRWLPDGTGFFIRWVGDVGVRISLFDLSDHSAMSATDSRTFPVSAIPGTDGKDYFQSPSPHEEILTGWLVNPNRSERSRDNA
jgi:hypothetical protein